MAGVFEKMNNSVHFVGIGGIGMSGIALILLRKGIKVSGSDLKENRAVNELRALGANIFIGHRALNVQGAGTVVCSSAVRFDNPEFIEAKRLGIPVIKRAQALARLMKDKFVITVAGSHGKTTTTSLVAYMLLEAGFSPTAAIGGILRNIDTNACLGNGEFFVAEADESDGSFLHYKPRMSIITNIDYEHLDYYNNFNNELEAFSQFINRTEKSGCVFCCDDDINIKSALKGYKNKYVLFGLSRNAHIHPRNILIDGLSSQFECFYNGQFIDTFYLALGGMHNISNALSVIALGLELGVDLKTIKKALADYKGASRRIEVKFKGSGYLVIDDYAHHPTEIKATLQAVKNIKPKRIIAVFQPHRYTRTQLLLNEFSRSFDMADCVIITDIYAASEQPLEGVTAKCLCDKIKKYAPDKYISFMPKDKLVRHILGIIKPSDLVITLGAGDITKTCDELVKELKPH